MKQIYPDLWQSEPEQPFADVPSVATHAYLLLRESGNVLFYSTSHEDDYRQIRELGGMTHQYLSHKDEVGPALRQIREMFGSELCCHRLEEEDVREACPVDRTFEARETQLGNIEVIPTPGHTRGSTCFLVRSPYEKTYLFTGDTIFRSGDGTWKNGFLSGISDKADLKKSLDLLRGLEPDVVISSASQAGIPFQEFSPSEWRAAVDAASAGL